MRFKSWVFFRVFYPLSQLVLIALILSLIGCAFSGFRVNDTYRPFRSGHGYLDLPLGKSLYEISYTGSLGQPELLVKKLALTRAAVIADSLKVSYFQVIEEASSHSLQTVTHSEAKVEPVAISTAQADTTQKSHLSHKNHASTQIHTTTETRTITVKLKVRLAANDCDQCLETNAVLEDARRSNWILNQK